MTDVTYCRVVFSGSVCEFELIQLWLLVLASSHVVSSLLTLRLVPGLPRELLLTIFGRTPKIRFACLSFDTFSG